MTESWTPDQQRTARGAALHPGNAIIGFGLIGLERPPQIANE
jgi:hypothetical protein